MRRLGLGGLVGVMLVSSGWLSTAHAQETRLFQNSWFWGVHGGVTTIGTPAAATSGAATFGGEWLITRTMGGLYAAFDQSSFTRMSGISDQSMITGMRPVEIRDMRTFSIGGVVFPMQLRQLRPYAGAGFAINVIGSATAEPDSIGGTVSTDMASKVDDARSRSAPFLLLGGQWQRQKTAVFLQAMLLPGDNNFLANQAMTSVTLGVRYNFGSSIEQ